jgi:uncharacterized protein (TIGR02231 family)
MRRAAVAFLLSTTCLAPALAAEFEPVSKIDAVTVFPQGADVTRAARLELPAGDHRIVLKGLPQGIDPHSLRVMSEGLGDIEITSVDTIVSPVSGDEQNGKRQKITDEMEALSVERNDLDQAIADADQQRQMLIALADKPLVPQSSTDTVRGIDVVQLTGLLDLVGTRLKALAKDSQAARLRQRAIDERTQDLSAQLAMLAPADQQRVDAVVHVAAAKASAGTLRLSYRLQEAGWQPYYDARLALPKAGATAQLDLIRRAEVTQYTNENWDDVALTLSTTRPSGMTQAPEEHEDEIFAAQAVLKLEEAKKRKADGMAAMESEMDESLAAAVGGMNDAVSPTLAKPAPQRQAMVEIAGFQANYVIAGRVSVDNSGQAKKLRIASAAQEAKLAIEVAPRLDAHAYLMARFALAGDGPLLPGMVNLYRDGVYVGQGSLPLLNPKEEARLGFGADDRVQVERKEVAKAVGEEGLLTSSNMREQAWDITVKNRGDAAVDVTVFDRMPFTAITDVEISALAGMTPPTETNVGKKRGVLSWSFNLAGHGENTIKTGYRISWPTSLQIGLVD